MPEPLFRTGTGDIVTGDFTRALRSIGILPEDHVMVHSDISVFGKLATYDRQFLFTALMDELKNAVTEEGILILPAFSYSFCENMVFEPVSTKSKVGALTEFFRKQPDVVRTMHPIFSFAIWGKNKDRYLPISKDSFDRDSVFGKLHKNQGKLLFLGAPFQSCTFIHYVEQMFGVPYRYMKTFSGTVLSGNGEYHEECTYFVRDLDREKNELDLSRLEHYLIGKGAMKSVRIGNGTVLLIDSGTLYDETMDRLNQDIDFLLKE